MKELLSEKNVSVPTKGQTAVTVLLSSIIGLIIIFIVICWVTPSNETTTSVNADFTGVSAICELATVKGYYHNVASAEKQPDGLFKYGWGQYGYKKFWLEYTGVVTAGIDCNKVTIESPDENGKIIVHLPDAEILSVDAEDESIAIVASETGLFTNIEAEDEAEAFAIAQENMENSVIEDNSLLAQAKTRAKKLLNEYILNVGKLIGQNYSVEFVDI